MVKLRPARLSNLTQVNLSNLDLDHDSDQTLNDRKAAKFSQPSSHYPNSPLSSSFIRNTVLEKVSKKNSIQSITLVMTGSATLAVGVPTTHWHLSSSVVFLKSLNATYVKRAWKAQVKNPHLHPHKYISNPSSLSHDSPSSLNSAPVTDCLTYISHYVSRPCKVLDYANR
jgi:hypothetical protein